MSAYQQRLHLRVVKDLETSQRRPRALGVFRILRYLVPPIFVCWHLKTSRPFTRNGKSYRVCLRCGMRRDFDVEEWKTKGDYYNPRAR
jgi:hypothetical protein